MSSSSNNTASRWFPTGTNSSDGWRLDIVSLLAVIGESSMESHSQALTSSWTCMLPRLIPAPQALLKPARPTRMPQVNAAVVGVHNGTFVPTLNFFPNIIHPIEELPPFAFKVYHITHTARKALEGRRTGMLSGFGKAEEFGSGRENANGNTRRTASGQTNGNRNRNTNTATSGIELDELEHGVPEPVRHRSSLQRIADRISNPDKPKPRVPTKDSSPLIILSVLSFLLTIGLLIWAALLQDGTAICAVSTISLASSIVGFASWWSPVLMNRNFHSRVPAGDVIIRTREGAFILVTCNEDVARELYFGTEECMYHVMRQPYRVLVGIGTFLLMISVVLLGNCNFTMQAAIGVSYIVLNFAFWVTSLFDKDRFWDLSTYDWEDITPVDAQDAHLKQSDAPEGMPCFTRTVWYAVRETKKIGWVRRGGAAPQTKEWDRWLQEAERNASDGNRTWEAVSMRERIVGLMDTTPVTRTEEEVGRDAAEQHAPAFDVPPQATK